MFQQQQMIVYGPALASGLEFLLAVLSRPVTDQTQVKNPAGLQREPSEKFSSALLM